MKQELQEKKQHLEEILREMGSVLVAYSSGVDSTFLLKEAHEVLGEQAVAVTARSCFFPRAEYEEAREFCEAEGIRLRVEEADVLAVEGVRQNPKNRCYLCKKNLFTRFLRIAGEEGLSWVAEGSNLDDLGDYRPGLAAVEELGIRSPLREASLTKAEIRELSREWGLSTWNKPSFACLASRFVYGETITEERLSMVEQAERHLMELGFRQMRVRIHGQMARIEVLPAEFPRILEGDTAGQLHRYLRELGFQYVTLDLGGYRMGSMNQMLNE